MQNSEYNPESIFDFKKSKLNKDAKGFSGTIPAGTTATLDHTLTDDVLITSGGLLCKDHAWGDKCTMQVLYGDTVVGQYVTDWFIDPTTCSQNTPKSNYPAKLSAGLKLRLVYTSTGATDVKIAINYDMERPII